MKSAFTFLVVGFSSPVSHPAPKYMHTCGHTQKTSVSGTPETAAAAGVAANRVSTYRIHTKLLCSSGSTDSRSESWMGFPSSCL